jgi:hypothetical protein
VGTGDNLLQRFHFFNPIFQKKPLGPLYHTTQAQMSWRKASVSAWVAVALPVASLSACWDMIGTGGAYVAK